MNHHPQIIKRGPDTNTISMYHLLHKNQRTAVNGIELSEWLLLLLFSTRRLNKTDHPTHWLGWEEKHGNTYGTINTSSLISSSFLVLFTLSNGWLADRQRQQLKLQGINRLVCCGHSLISSSSSFYPLLSSWFRSTSHSVSKKKASHVLLLVSYYTCFVFDCRKIVPAEEKRRRVPLSLSFSLYVAPEKFIDLILSNTT